MHRVVLGNNENINRQRSNTVDYLKNAKTIISEGRALSFIRCDKDGNEIPPEHLAQMNFSNATIAELVTGTAMRIGMNADEDGAYSQGFTTM